MTLHRDAQGPQVVLQCRGVSMKALPDPFGPKIDVPAMQLDIEIMHRHGYLKKTDFGARKPVDHSLLDEIIAGR
jgi:hypothetical protein